MWIERSGDLKMANLATYDGLHVETPYPLLQLHVVRRAVDDRVSAEALRYLGQLLKRSGRGIEDDLAGLGWCPFRHKCAFTRMVWGQEAVFVFLAEFYLVHIIL